MKRKLIIIVAIVAVLALGSTLVLAAVDDDGNLVNPFTRILSGKVEEGVISQSEADIFSKVWEVIKGEAEPGKRGEKMQGRRNGESERPKIDEKVMIQIKELMKAKTDEIISGLAEKGVIDSSLPDDENTAGLKAALKDADDETKAAVREAFSEMDGYLKSIVEGMVDDGTLSQEEADMLLRRGGKPGTPSKGGRHPHGPTQSEEEESPQT